MKTTARLIVFCAAFILLGSTGAEARMDLSALNLLKDVVPQSVDGELILRFEFEKPLEGYIEPVIYKKSVQIDFPQSYIKPAKRYFPTGDSEITQVYVSQFSPKKLRVRLILGDEAGDLSDRFRIEKKGRYLTFRLARNEPVDILDHFLARAAGKVDRAEEKAGTRAPVTRISTREAFPVSQKPPADRLSSSADPEPAKTKQKDPKPEKISDRKERGILGTRVSKESEPLNLMSTGIRMLAMLSLVLGLIFLLFFVFKKYVLKNTIFGGGDKLIKVLGTGYLAPKKNITLVEVAGEVLVLGISNDTISLLANIREKEKIDRIKNAKEGADPRGSLSGVGTPGSTAPQSIIQGFSKYLKQFSGKEESKDQSMAAVTDQIRRNLGRIKTA